MEYYGNNDWRDYHLSHHGILGMKWGIRRFQPYSVHPRKGGASGKEVGDAKTISRNQRKNAKEIRRHIRKYGDLKDSSQVQKLYDDLTPSRNKVKDAYANVIEFNKLSDKHKDKLLRQAAYDSAYSRYLDKDGYTPKGTPGTPKLMNRIKKEAREMYDRYKSGPPSRLTQTQYKQYLRNKLQGPLDDSSARSKAELNYALAVDKKIKDTLGKNADSYVRRFRKKSGKLGDKLTSEIVRRTNEEFVKERLYY